MQNILGAFKGWFTDGPWRSKSVLAAVVIVLIGTAFWFHGIKGSSPQAQTDSSVTNAVNGTALGAATAAANSHWIWNKPFPSYVPMGASYVVGFCLGWLFRRLIRMVAVIGALIIAMLALGKFVGWNTTHTQEQVKRGSAWAQHELSATSDYIKSSLPWAATGGVGAFLGFRRRRQVAAPKPAG